jgi:uncharacterized membrane protein YdjX (TVP38/TMEM64 family)
VDGDRPGPGVDAAARRAAYLRLAGLSAVLTAAFLAFWVFDVVDRRDVREVVDEFGWAAPAAYVVVSTFLGAALVPGPILAGASGLLFGALVGTVVTIISAVGTSLVALHVARRTTGDAFHTVSGPRLQALADLAERHGLVAVIVARLAPVLPDAPVSYVFGVIGLNSFVVALGTAIGAAPRAFSYTSIGASLDDPGSPLAYAGVAGVIVTGIVGLVLARRLLRSPRESPARPRPRRSGAGRGRTPPSAG